MGDTKILQTIIDGQESLVKIVGNNEKMIKAVINGQSAMKQELLSEIGKVRSEVNELKSELKSVENNLTKRIDKLGLQIARLEDDAPTIEEFDELEKRVTVLESVAS